MNSCIYLITNLVNGKIYVGQTVDLDNRLYEHFHKEKCTGRKFKNAIKKYGKEKFKHEVLEYVEPKRLNEREQHYLDLYQPFDDKGYNLQRYSEKTNFGKEWDDEFKEKVSNGLKEYYKDKPGTFTGRKHTEESKKKMSKNRSGILHTEEWKLNMSKINKEKNSIERLNYWIEKNGHPRLTPVVQLDKKTGDTIKEFSSIKEAYETVGISRTALTNCLKGRTQTSGGYKWVYLEDFNK